MSQEWNVSQDQITETFSSLASWASSGAMMVGGVIPYIPQYREIKRTSNADGFSTYVCLVLLVANTLRIIFWFGHPFELPLLFQSLIMNVAMLGMMHLCVKTRKKTMIIPQKSHIFSDFDLKYFWDWTDFLSYLEFMATFTAATGVFMYFFVDRVYIVESLGFLAVFTEAMLGTPQFLKNFQKRSTFGMSKKMVCLWTVGDVFKTTYFIVRDSPVQFTFCGFLQVGIDVAILLQVAMFRSTPAPLKILIKQQAHTS